jgi:toxin ParE1/3/4
MTDEPILRPQALEDLREAYAWYEAQRPGLGEEFFRCVDACLSRIARMPELHAIVRDNYRRALVRRFPYAVFYEHAEGITTVYAVFHCSQDPKKWQDRLP